MKKILALIRHPVGGIRTYVRYVYGGLSPKKYAFVIVQPESNVEKISPSDLPFHQTTFIHVSENWAPAGLAAKAFSLGGEKSVDLIHAHGLTSAVSALSLKLNPASAPLVVTPHDVFRDDLFSGLLGPFKKSLVRKSLLNANVVQNVGNDARRNLLQFFPNLLHKGPEIIVIRNGINVARFHDDSAPEKDFRPPVKFGFLGRFMEQKGFLVLVDSVSRLNKAGKMPKAIQFIAVNDGAYSREYREIVQKRGLEPFFQFRGYQENVGQIFRELDALVIPSLWEACPLLPMEALSWGIPVLGSDCIGLKEVLKDSPALLHQAGDSASLLRSLQTFMDAPQNFTKDAKEFAPDARALFDAQKTSIELDSLFDRILR